MTNEGLAVVIVVCYAVAIVIVSHNGNGPSAGGLIENLTRALMWLVSLRK